MRANHGGSSFKAAIDTEGKLTQVSRHRLSVPCVLVSNTSRPASLLLHFEMSPQVVGVFSHRF